MLTVRKFGDTLKEVSIFRQQSLDICNKKLICFYSDERHVVLVYEKFQSPNLHFKIIQVHFIETWQLLSTFEVKDDFTASVYGIGHMHYSNGVLIVGMNWRKHSEDDIPQQLE